MIPSVKNGSQELQLKFQGTKETKFKLHESI